MELKINGAMVDVTHPPETPLLWVLRDEIGLTGTKYGCGAGICGACTVHIDGEARRSCVIPLAAVESAEIRTIEGLATLKGDGSIELHPVQQAFIDEQTPQCGWCMSGQIMTAAALLSLNPSPSDEEIVQAMGNNICRCGCYVRIKRAVVIASQLMAQEEQNI